MLRLVVLAALLPARASIPAAYGVVTHRTTATVVEGTAPLLTVKAAEANVALVVQCTAGEETLRWETGEVPMGEERNFALAFKDATVRAAECGVYARLANGLAEKLAVPVQWTVEPLKKGEPAPETPDVVAPKADEDEP